MCVVVCFAWRVGSRDPTRHTKQNTTHHTYSVCRAANAIQHWPRDASTRRALNQKTCFLTKPTFCVFILKIIKIPIGSNYLLELSK